VEVSRGQKWRERARGGVKGRARLVEKWGQKIFFEGVFGASKIEMTQ